MTDCKDNQANIEENQQECEISTACLPEDLNEAIKELPVEQKKKVLHSFSLYMQRSFSPISNPLLEKLDTALVGKLIDNSENESIRDYTQNKFDKICGIVILILVLSTTGILLYIFRNHIEDIKDFIMPIIYIGVGAIGGYGYKSMRGKD